MEYKSFDFEIKDAIDLGNDEWIIEGYASAWTLDNGLDIVMRGAFLETLKNRFSDVKAKNNKSKIKVLWQHKTDDIIGQLLDAYEDDFGLFVRIKLIKHECFVNAEKAYVLAKLGELDSFSIGYAPLVIKENVEYTLPSGKTVFVREIYKLKLYEVSLVTFPMNELAEFTNVKKEELKENMGDQVTALLADIKSLLQQGIDMMKQDQQEDSTEMESCSEDSNVIEEKGHSCKSCGAEMKMMCSKGCDSPKKPMPKEENTENLEEKLLAILTEKLEVLVSNMVEKKFSEKETVEEVVIEEVKEETVTETEPVIEPIVEEVKEEIHPELKEEDILNFLLNSEFKLK